jgi:hypothetical protein
MWDLVVTWLPLFALAGAVIGIGLKQMRDYRSHVENVSALNREIAELNRRNHEIAKAQLTILTEIKTLLENRKP